MSSATDAPPRQAAFASRLGVLAATLGSAVGLGNIWKFPSVTGANGGAAFILLYLLCTLLVGLPLLVSELVLGRRGKADAVTTLRNLSGGRGMWEAAGVCGVLSAFLILAFYSEVGGWVFAYLFRSLRGDVLTADPVMAAANFAALISDPMQSLLWQWLILLLVGGIIVLGVNSGIEKCAKILMPVLFLLLVAVGIRSMTLPGAARGVEFLLHPDFTAVTGGALLAALGLSFFKLSLGVGTMITYGSYFRDDQDIPATALRVMLADLAVSLLAGLAVFPAVFALDFKPDAGPPLLFITIPAVFASMPMGGFFMALFFLLSAIAATGAMMSMLEVPVAFLCRRYGCSRLKGVSLCFALLAVVATPASLSGSVTRDLRLFGMNMFELFDFATSGILLPGCGLLFCLFTGWVLGKRAAADELGKGRGGSGVIVDLLLFVIRFVSPLLVALILVAGLM